MGEQKFSISEFCSNSQTLFGVYPEVIHGALRECPNEKFTISEVKEAINNFVKKGV